MADSPGPGQDAGSHAAPPPTAREHHLLPPSSGLPPTHRFSVFAWLFPRSMPLSAQLLIAFVGLVVATTVALSLAAYQSSVDTAVDGALVDAGEVAQTTYETLRESLEIRQRRAQVLLVSVESICGEPAGDRGFGFSEECVRPLVEEMRMTERARGVRLMFRGRTIRTSGEPLAEGMPAPNAIALVVPRGPGQADLLLRAVHGELTLMLQIDSGDLLSAAASSKLGRSGEIILMDPDGRFLTQARYSQAPGTPPGASVSEPLRECRAYAGVRIGIDYRGIETIHGFHPVDEIGGGCIDVHIAYSETLEAAEEIRTDLVLRGAILSLIGAFMSMIAAYRIAAPVRRLARSARIIQAGNFAEPIPVGGPAEVRALGHALASMAAELSKLVSTEQTARLDAESANRSKDRFLALVSHELRTPLNAVLGWTRLLSTGYLNEERTRRALEAIERNAQAQQQLIEDLLDVSRIVAGRLRMERVPVHLVPEIEAALETIRPVALDKNLRIEARLEEDLEVSGDSQRLRQIVWNLVSNAVKFTPPEGLVSVALRRKGNRAELSVTDSGIGISPDVLPHVFEWFRQADGNIARQETGLGLGLGLVKQLVELHGGTVSAQSAGEGRGATFTVILPLRGAPNVRPQRPANARKRSSDPGEQANTAP